MAPRIRPNSLRIPALFLGPILHTLGPAVPVVAAGGFAFESLRHPLTASQTVMGGPSPVGEGGAENLRANPAALARSRSAVFDISHQTWQYGLQEQWAGGVLLVGPTAIAAEVSAVHAGSLPSFDEEGNRTGSFQPLELVIGIGAARPIGDRLRLGAGLHLLHLGAPGEDLRGIAFDIGAEGDLLGGTIGLALRGLGPDLVGESGTYPLPSEVGLGVERRLGRTLNLTVAASSDRANDLRFHGGVRWDGLLGVGVLAGWAYRPDADLQPFRPGAGLEFKVGSLQVSYGFVPDDDLGTTQHISLRFVSSPRFGWDGTAQAASSPDREPDPSGRSVVVVAELPPDATWTVWGGTHRSRPSAQGEVRALLAQKIDGTAVIESGEGLFRVRVATGLEEEQARSLARRLGITCSPE